MSEKRTLMLFADDYGLSPGISAAIRTLIAARKISGTGCMTLFPEWREEARLLRDIGPHKAQIGLHLTLTDFVALSGNDQLARNGRLPDLRSLIAATAFTLKYDEAVHAELDAQLNAFEAAMGRMPAYIDGHQHVHFLPPVRRWLIKRASQWNGERPWLRGAPSFAGANSMVLRAKIAFAAFLARGFNDMMQDNGYDVRGPLCGFYEWHNDAGFAPMLQRLLRAASNEAVVMCHPGYVDELLEKRDVFVQARQTEFDVLLNGNFIAN